MNSTSDEIEIDLRELLFVIRRRLWLILLAGILAAGCVGAFCKFRMTPQYTSSTKIYVVGRQASISSLSLSDLQMGSQLTKDYKVLIQSRPVFETVIGNLGLDMEYQELAGRVTVTNPQDTRILEISVKYPDPYLAKQIVDEVAAVSSQQIAAIMDMNEPNIVEDGVVPTEKSSPHVTKNAAIAGILGIFLMALICCARYLLNDTIQSKEDVEKYLGLTTIGVIPEFGSLDDKGAKGRKHKKMSKGGRQ